MPDARADAPGRVNLIGEHTDYQDGFVLPAVIPQRTTAVVAARPDRLVHASSTEPGHAPSTYELGGERRGGGWVDYVQGLTVALRARGIEVGGFDLAVSSRVPLGSGLSSSAALEVSVLRALRAAFQLTLDDLEIACVAQTAEVEFVGAPVGIMDQMAASLGGDGEALFIDTRSLQYERIPLPSSFELLVVNSGIRHQHAGGEYVTRRRESEEAARLLHVVALRDLGPADLERVNRLPSTLAARARHVITENTRVLNAVAALRAGNAVALGRLFAASHASLRDDYEVSVPAVDRLVELGVAHPDIFGARMTGGGFGGAVVMLARPGTARAAATALLEAYDAATGLKATVLVPDEMRSCN